MKKVVYKKKVLLLLVAAVLCSFFSVNRGNAVVCTHYSRSCNRICITPWLMDGRVQQTPQPQTVCYGSSGRVDVLPLLEGNCGWVWVAGLYKCTISERMVGPRSTTSCTNP